MYISYRTKRKLKWLAMIAAFTVLISSVSFMLSGSALPVTEALGSNTAAESEKAINWTMYGTLVSAEGRARGSMEIPLILVRNDCNCPNHYLFDITLPDYFRYTYKSRDPLLGFISYSSSFVCCSRFEELPYLVADVGCLGKFRSDFYDSTIGLDLEKQYMIIEWNDGTGQFLVASTDPDTDPAEILEHFKDLIYLNSYDLRNAYEREICQYLRAGLYDQIDPKYEGICYCDFIDMYRAGKAGK